MKKIFTIILAAIGLSVLSTNVFAGSNNFPPLDKVSFQLTAQQWATTKTAKVIVGVNAALSDAQLGTIHNQIMANLKRIAAGDVQWHITRFSRSKGQTGLEQLYVQATARLPEFALANLRQKAKSISKPGASYKIVAIQFTPSQQEIEQVRAQLRSKIYGEANAELQRLNKVYPTEKYFLHSISFSAGVTPAPRMMLAKVAAPESSMAVSNKVQVSANVVLASSVHGGAAQPKVP